ncbi:MAG: hypothetical protein Q9191_005906, partial [Dirinaria sp. TL-2023a]
MADETESGPPASSQSIAQGTGHSAAPSPTRGHNENNVSVVPPNALPPQPQPDPTSSTQPTLQATHPESRLVNNSSSAPSVAAGQAANAMDSSGPSPYGTRSRHRTGNSRPNYAEDRDIDGEYEWPTTKKSQAPPASTPSSQSQTVDSDKSSGINTRRSSTTASAAPGSKQVTSTSKDQIPGMSSFSLGGENPTSAPPPTRKRKAPGSNAAPNTSAGTEYIPAHGNTRKLVVASASHSRETNMMSFEGSGAYLRDGKLEADDGTILAVDDNVYLVCEPPGDPYYLARIMEFVHTKNDPNLPIDSLKVNWYYRPRDCNRKVNDTRQVFATMHSDVCPLTSVRGTCQISHRDSITDLDEYRKTRDNFWYEKMFDRYIHRYYEIIPTDQVINVPARVKKVLDERWKFVVVELGRGKELTSAIKTCKRCSGYCASRKQERKLEARNTPLVGDRAREAEEEELLEEEEEEPNTSADLGNGSTQKDKDPQSAGPKPATADQIAQAKMWPYRYFGIHCRVEDALDFDDRIYPRASSRLGPKHQANVHVWHGQPVKLVKPAESRRKNLKGGNHKKDSKFTKEAVAEVEINKTTKEKRAKWVMEEPAGYVARGEDHSNNDPANTAKLMFRMPQVGESSSRGLDDHPGADLDLEHRQKIIEDYMENAKENVAAIIGVSKFSANFLDKALELLVANNYAAEPALEQLKTMNRRRDIKDPEFSPEEIKKFGEGVKKYGSEHRFIFKHVGKSHKLGEIIRFYYMWKKSPAGQAIWNNLESRKSKKSAKQVDAKLVDDVADDVDDSAFDNAKASARKRGFQCKFCDTRQSPQWRRAPNTAPGTTVPIDLASKNSKDKSAHLMVALCQRCAGLWRRYGIEWENVDEVAKKLASGGGRSWKRKIDEELLGEFLKANEVSSIGISSQTAATASSVGVEVPSGLTIQPAQDGPRKKQKTVPETQNVQNAVYTEPPKKKVVEKPPEPPLVPEAPRIRVLPCAVCDEMEPLGNQHLCCRHCRLTVHRNCYGVPEGRSENKWTCDMCANDSSSQISTSYECILCPIRPIEQELMEPPRVSHKKKGDREREKEKLERELVLEKTNLYYREQEAKGRPLHPREPLKRTSGNNWVHVICSMWVPELRYGDAKLLEPVEGVSAIPQSRYLQTCKICKRNDGVCVACKQCSITYHVSCAQRHGHVLGFDVTPVKGSRRDAVSVLTLGTETGNATPVVYCKEHTIKTTVHLLNEAIEGSPLNALQLFAQMIKQADTSLTGTVRKAANIVSSSRAINQMVNPIPGHRNSNASAAAATTKAARVSPATMTVKSEEVDEEGDRVVYLNEAPPPEQHSKRCASCNSASSPLWHKIPIKALNMSARPLAPSDDSALSQAQSFEHPPLTNGHVGGRPSADSPDHSQPDVPSQVTDRNSQAPQGIDGIAETNGNGHRDSPAELPSHQNHSREGRRASSLGIERTTGFHCHKCHIKKLRNPTPPPAPLPQPDDVVFDARTVHEREAASSPRRPVWNVPAVPPMPPQEPFSYPPPSGP